MNHTIKFLCMASILFLTSCGSDSFVRYATAPKNVQARASSIIIEVTERQESHVDIRVTIAWSKNDSLNSDVQRELRNLIERKRVPCAIIAFPKEQKDVIYFGRSDGHASFLEWLKDDALLGQYFQNGSIQILRRFP